MSVERVKSYFRELGMERRVWEFETSSATVELAAETLGVRPARIAKTLSFAMGDGCVLVVTAGDARIDNKKFKGQFETKARMLAFEEVERLTAVKSAASARLHYRAYAGISRRVAQALFNCVSGLWQHEQRHRDELRRAVSIQPRKDMGGCLQGLGRGRRRADRRYAACGFNDAGRRRDHAARRIRL
jgi:hypothetical protein